MDVIEFICNSARKGYARVALSDMMPRKKVFRFRCLCSHWTTVKMKRPKEMIANCANCELQHKAKFVAEGKAYFIKVVPPDSFCILPKTIREIGKTIIQPR